MTAAPAQRPDPAAWPEDRLTCSWLGHATVLLNFLGRRIVTDPALETRVGIGRGPLKLGPRRLAPPALRARELPPLDLVLLSLAHMDTPTWERSAPCRAGRRWWCSRATGTWSGDFAR